MIRMTAIKDYDDYTYYHEVRMWAGRLPSSSDEKLASNKKRLSELREHHILHDIGKVNIPKEILNKRNLFY